ncbi:MAG: FAD-dependent tricarballylate dehydrogenase TcuA [Rhodospirillales bacterium]|nr:FAD-dependent tricarballylate dehydrogenase TcuA [Rhodospirillales bacterium]
MPDILVIGGGHAALAAAITARRLGASVLVAEAAPRPMRGGNTRHTRNLRAVHDAPRGTLTGAYLEDEYWDDLLRVTHGQTDEALARMTIRASADLVSFLSDCGVRFQPSLAGTLSLSRTNAFFLGGGKALLNALYREAERLGVSVCYETPARAMTMRQGTIAEVVLRTPGGELRVVPRAVVAAAGGFQANIAWMREYWGEAAENFVIRGTPYAQGDVLRLLLDGGCAPVGDPTQFHAVALDGRAPRFDGGIATRLDSVPFSIVVNRDGQRFYDEGEDLWPKRYAIWGRLIAQQPGQVAFSICDAPAARDFMPSVYPAVTAPTIAHLARALGLDPLALAATVADYNAAVRGGAFDPTVLDSCHTEGLAVAKTHWARRIETPPFVGYPLRPGITFTYLGVRVDATARVRLADGTPAPNLFAAGEIMAGNILGRGYLAGFGMTIGGVFGRLAGEGAARHAGN